MKRIEEVFNYGLIYPKNDVFLKSNRVKIQTKNIIKVIFLQIYMMYLVKIIYLKISKNQTKKRIYYKNNKKYSIHNSSN